MHIVDLLPGKIMHLDWIESMQFILINFIPLESKPKRWTKKK